MTRKFSLFAAAFVVVTALFGVFGADLCPSVGSSPERWH
jgi:hypothetical protein